MLFRFFRWLIGQPAQQTQPTPTANGVSREELEAAIERAHREATYEWNEMYEKFNALHLRLSKRDKRAKAQREDPGFELDEEQRPGVLQLRRFGSP